MGLVLELVSLFNCSEPLELLTMTILLQRRVKAEIEAAEKARESLQRTLSQ